MDWKDLFCIGMMNGVSSSIVSSNNNENAKVLAVNQQKIYEKLENLTEGLKVVVQALIAYDHRLNSLEGKK